MQSKTKTLLNELNVHATQINKIIMHVPKIKLRAHKYQDTTEIKMQIINKQCKDMMVQ